MQTQTELRDLLNFLNEMRSTTSNNKKLEILKSLGTESERSGFIRSIFRYTYNPFWKYNVHSRNCIKNSHLCDSTESRYTDIFTLLNDLKERVITGHSAISAINGYTQNLPEDLTKVIHLIIDRDLQMRASTSSINKVFPKTIPTYNVALANAYKPGMVDFLNENEKWYGSRKLDGVRCLAFKQGDEVKFTSRSGKPFLTLDVIKEQMLQIEGDYIFDGEICIVDENNKEDFQGIIKEIRRKGHTIENPKFLVFDCLTLEEFESKTSTAFLKTRSERMAVRDLENKPNIEWVEQVHLTSDEQFAEMVSDAEKQGFEGIMVRKNTNYEGKRSKNLLKVKKFYDEEYTVKRCDLGDMRFVENGKEVVKDVLRNIIIEHKGYDVGVGSGFSKEQREYYFKNPNELLGKTVTIQYFEETQNQMGGVSLRFPVIKHIYQNGRDC